MHRHHSGLYLSGGQPSVLVFLLCLAVMQHIMFLHGGVLAAPLHQTESLLLHALNSSTTTGLDSNGTTMSGPPSLFSSPPDIETHFADSAEDFDNITLVGRDTGPHPALLPIDRIFGTLHAEGSSQLQ